MISDIIADIATNSNKIDGNMMSIMTTSDAVSTNAAGISTNSEGISTNKDMISSQMPDISQLGFSVQSAITNGIME